MEQSKKRWSKLLNEVFKKDNPTLIQTCKAQNLNVEDTAEGKKLQQAKGDFAALTAYPTLFLSLFRNKAEEECKKTRMHELIGQLQTLSLTVLQEVQRHPVCMHMYLLHDGGEEGLWEWLWADDYWIRLPHSPNDEHCGADVRNCLHTQLARK